MISILISHPTEGLILYETGCGHDYPRVWGAPLNDLFNRVDFSPEHEYVLIFPICPDEWMNYKTY
jgi:hypothetical protein